MDWLDELARDIRIGFRGLARDRVFAVAVILILTLGTGTTVAMFSVLNTVVLRPLPYARPNQLVRINTHLMHQDQFDGSSLGNFYDWQRQSRTIAAMTFYRRTSVSAVTYAGADAPQRAQEGLVGPEFFDVLGTRPIVGRTFSREEFNRGDPVVVIGEGLWQEQFARSPDVVTRTLVIDGRDHTILGVMPATFQMPTPATRFWRPMSVVPDFPRMQNARSGDQFEVIGRLAGGASLQDASAEMEVIGRQLREAYATVNDNLDIRLLTLFDHVVGARTRRAMWMGFAAVLSLQVIACLNVGGLLSARAAKRKKELALRSALGAGRSRLIRQLLAEGISLWAVSSVTGLLLATALIRLILWYGPRTLPRIEQLGLDAFTLVVALAGGLVVVLVCGTIPALTAAKTDGGAVFASRDQSSLPRHPLQDWLVSGQIAGALMLLVAALLFARSFLTAQAENPGFPSDNLLIVRVDLPRPTYPAGADNIRFFNEASDRLGRLPGVIAVGGITDFFIRRNAGQWVTIEGQSGEQQPDARLATEGVTPGFFRSMGIEIIDGRDFEPRDYQPGAPPVYIVGESLARKFWPGQSAVGKRLVGGTTPPKDGRWATVVGVVRDLRREGLDVNPILLGFIPSYLRGMDMTIHVASGAEGLIPAVREELRSIDRALPITNVFTARSLLADRLSPRQFETEVLGLFAAIALLLSAAGLYALLAYQVALRTREIGVRAALGADRFSIVTMVLRRGMTLALAGAAAGITGAAATARVLESLLYQTPALHLATYAGAIAFVLTVAVMAAGIPAIRASRLSPMNALREE